MKKTKTKEKLEKDQKICKKIISEDQIMKKMCYVANKCELPFSSFNDDVIVKKLVNNGALLAWDGVK